MLGDLLHVPTFARIDDYAGLWAIEPQRAALIWKMSQQIDFVAHMAQPLEPVAALEKQPTSGGKSIAVVKLTGLLMKQQTSIGGTSTIQARRDIRQAAADPDVSAILLAIDSPGGTVAGTSDLADEVKAARKSKPVWAQIEDLGASAAYWVASQADYVVANSPTAMVGSIGTVWVIQDVSAAAEKEGIKTFVFATGPLKGAGAAGSRMSEEHAAYFQGLVDAMQTSFDAGVRSGRNLSAKELQAVRTGGVFPATEALRLKLVDAVQPIGRTIAQLSKGFVPERQRMAVPAFASLPMLRRHLPMLSKQELT